MKATDQRRMLLAVYVMALLVITLAPLPAGGEFVETIPGLGLVFLLYWNARLRRGQAAVIKAIGLTVAAAALIEVMQAPLPYRSGDAWDFLAGAVGALLGGAAAALLGGRRG
jgi:VanZ family protein